MGNYIIGFTCRPHYKEDADHCWMTREGELDIRSTNRIVSLWMPAQNSLTLEDVARLMENLASSEVDRRLESYSGSIDNMTFRGETIPREQLKSVFAKDYIREGESFTARLAASRSPRPVVWCPCFICYTVANPHHPADSVTHTPPS